ncbi:MAG: hypothetical protein QOJ64_2047 [Acidobacteriota bacterium]|jgi:hypothetical protein|nr:hypothetical protein [Acidobacteriota bacterium]
MRDTSRFKGLEKTVETVQTGLVAAFTALKRDVNDNRDDLQPTT